MRFNKTREIIAVILTASKSLDVGMHSEVYEPIWFKFSRMIATLGHFDSSLDDLDLHSRSQDCKKVKTSAPIIS